MTPDELSTTEQEKKRTGMDFSASKNKTILLIFRSIAQRISFDIELGQAIPITIDDVRREAERIGIHYEPGNWMGSVFRGWQWTGRMIASTHKEGHARMVKVWERS